MSYRMNGGKWNTQAWNGLANLTEIAVAERVLYNQTSIVLQWGEYLGAIYYQLQVSLFPDFRSNFVDTTLTQTKYAFTDSQTNDAKRYWRWRPSSSSGTDWLTPWSTVGSYWLNTGAAAEVTMPEGYWALFDKDLVTDIYFFDLAPVYTVIPRNIYRYQGRNRAAKLLSEFLTVKDELSLSFTGGQFVIHQQMDEFRRFHNTKRTFFLANYTFWKHDEPIPNIWKVESADDPTFTMIAAGRPDI